RRNGGEVEAVQALYGREPRLLDPTLHHASFAVDQFQFGQAQQKADMIEALGGALPPQPNAWPLAIGRKTKQNQRIRPAPYTGALAGRSGSLRGRWALLGHFHFFDTAREP